MFWQIAFVCAEMTRPAVKTCIYDVQTNEIHPATKFESSGGGGAGEMGPSIFIMMYIFIR